MIRFCKSFIAVMVAVIICVPCVSMICVATENPCLDTTESHHTAIETYSSMGSASNSNEEESDEIETESSEPDNESTVPEEEIIPATDIDIEDFESPILIGKSQLISASVIPINSTDTEIVFTSLTPEIASVNAVGRVSALNKGTAKIEIRAGAILRTILLEIIDSEVQDIPAEEIDLSYEDTMIVGTTQTLYPSLRPTNATSDVTYSSSDSNIATVNSFGKVTAVAPGTVHISAFAGEISTKIQIIVEAEKSVTSIDVSDFKNEMKVGETQTITTSLFPADAENQNIQFYSSNSNVATISNSGFITAIAKGTTTISIYCGSASRFLQLTVYVPTEEIKLSESFVVLRPKEAYQIDVIVMPGDADQEMTYKSTNPSVATVSANGLVTAIAPGNASIILENHDSMKSITIIVNEHGKVTNETEMDEVEIDGGSSNYSDIVVNMIGKCADGETIIVSGADYSFVTTEVLQLLYNTNKALLIQYDKYTIEIQGKKVQNPHNGFSSQLQLLDTKTGLEFEIDNATALPGEINIHFEELDKTYKYLYLYNEVSEKYEKLNELSQQEAKINIAGKYLITTQKIRSFNIPTLFIIAGGTLLTAGTTIYVVTKKKYLFW